MIIVLIHYGEIVLKGKNRPFFERCLILNIKEKLRKIGLKKLEIEKEWGRVLIKINQSRKQEEVKKSLKTIFGISNFAFVKEAKLDIKDIQEKSLSSFREEMKTTLKKRKIIRFNIKAKRSNKKFPLTSPEINKQVGKYILSQLGKKVKVDYKNYEIIVFIEIIENKALIYTEKISGLGGLPIGVSGRIVSLISSGIDSPVASYLLMKRGGKIIFLHFHSAPYTSEASKNNVEKLVKILSNYQLDSKLIFISFIDIQKEIVANAPANLRVILYRRAMFKIGQEIAKIYKAQALATGESLGQVASQTIENISVINQVVNLPIFRPLIGFDKQEIIDLAKKIGTYDISILPYEDCCSLFIPAHPKTKAKLFEIENVEKKLNLEKLIAKAIKNREEKIINFYD